MKALLWTCQRRIESTLQWFCSAMNDVLRRSYYFVLSWTWKQSYFCPHSRPKIRPSVIKISSGVFLSHLRFDSSHIHQLGEPRQHFCQQRDEPARHRDLRLRLWLHPGLLLQTPPHPHLQHSTGHPHHQPQGSSVTPCTLDMLCSKLAAELNVLESFGDNRHHNCPTFMAIISMLLNCWTLFWYQ